MKLQMILDFNLTEYHHPQYYSIISCVGGEYKLQSRKKELERARTASKKKKKKENKIQRNL